MKFLAYCIVLFGVLILNYQYSAKEEDNTEVIVSDTALEVENFVSPLPYHTYPGQSILDYQTLLKENYVYIDPKVPKRFVKN